MCTLQFVVYAFLTGFGSRRTSAFAPGFSSVRQGRQILPSPATLCSMSKEKDAAGKALEQAAKLRKEIADLEQDLARGAVCNQTCRTMQLQSSERSPPPCVWRSFKFLTQHTHARCSYTAAETRAHVHTHTHGDVGIWLSSWYCRQVLTRLSGRSRD